MRFSFKQSLLVRSFLGARLFSRQWKGSRCSIQHYISKNKLSASSVINHAVRRWQPCTRCGRIERRKTSAPLCQTRALIRRNRFLVIVPDRRFWWTWDQGGSGCLVNPASGYLSPQKSQFGGLWAGGIMSVVRSECQAGAGCKHVCVCSCAHQ